MIGSPLWFASPRAGRLSPGQGLPVSHASGHRAAVIADLVQGLEAYFAEHRECDGLAGDIVEETVGGQLAHMLAAAGAKVSLSTVAVSRARCADLATQVARAQLGVRPDLAVILVGTNDATHLVRPGEAAAALATAVRRLRDAGTAVVVGTCPDLAALRAVAPPLRQIVGWYGRRVARAQASAADGGALARAV